MLHQQEFEAQDIHGRMRAISTLGDRILECHDRGGSSLYYSVGDFFVEVRFEGPEKHPCLSMTSFSVADPLCDRMLERLSIRLPEVNTGDTH